MKTTKFTPMKYAISLLFLFVWVGLASPSGLYAQVQSSEKESFILKGKVLLSEDRTPVSGIEISSDRARFAQTDSQGQYRIRVQIGDLLTFQGEGIISKRHIVNSKDDVVLLVEQEEEMKVASKESAPSKKISKRAVSVERSRMNAYRRYLDSAGAYATQPIQKSLDWVTLGIDALGTANAPVERASAYELLGRIYEFHKQYDLAIDNYRFALRQSDTPRTRLCLAQVLLQAQRYAPALDAFKDLEKSSEKSSDEQIAIWEGMADALLGLNQNEEARSYYQKALDLAAKLRKNNLMTDLNSKIGEAYEKEDLTPQADQFFSNSLQLAEQQNPARAIEENEKVADYYNRTARYDDEIQLRKKSLDQIQQLPKNEQGRPVYSSNDTITPQRINYKIAKAYIQQNQYDEAIPNLEKSIEEADSEADLIVQKDATRKLAEVLKYKGDYTAALETYQAYVALVDTLYVRKEQEISRAARMNRDIASKQARISSLEQDRQLAESKYDLALTEQELGQERNRIQKTVIYALCAGLLFLGLTAYLFYRNFRQQQFANRLLDLKSLRSQMNPHFIFNALNSVNNFIAKSDERSANRYLTDFSTLMRSVLENSEEDFIPLTKEIELLRLYMKLEHSRFPEKFDYQLEVDPHLDTEGFSIPPMLLQPYIENAIWHGLRYKEEKGELLVRLEPMGGERIRISITDDGIGRKQSKQLKTKNQKKQQSKGMGNIQRRIAILNALNAEQVKVEIQDLFPDGRGTRVELELAKK